MIQHFLEERFHKAVRFFSGVIVNNLEIRGNLKVNGIVDIGGVDPVDEGFKEYVASLTQTGTGAPVATVIKNTLGGTPVWSRAGAGQYTATLLGAFPTGKAQLFPPPFDANTLASGISYSLEKASANAVSLLTYSGGALADDILNGDQVISFKVWD